MHGRQLLLPTQRLRAAGGEDDVGWHSVELPGRGTTYAYDRPHPSAAAPTVVLLHGLTATGAMNWSAALDALSEHYHVVALDHRGHGRGIRGEDEFTLEDCADDAVALLDVLGVGTAIFVGYSMGGPIAQLIWRRHGGRVSGLVLCATAADFTTPLSHRPLVEALARLQRTHTIVPPWVRRRVAGQLVTGLVTDPAMRIELLEAMSSHAEHTIHEAARAIRRFRSTGWIGGIDVPVVVVVTARDRLVRPTRQRQLATAIPDARIITVDAGHFAAFTQPDLIAGAVSTACAVISSRSSAAPKRRRFGPIIGFLYRRGPRRKIRATRARKQHRPA